MASRSSAGSAAVPARGSRRRGCGRRRRPAAGRSATRGPGRRPRSGCGSGRRCRPARRRGARRRRWRGRGRSRASRSARRRRTALAGVSRPTALPIRACLVGYDDSTTATRRSAGGMCRSRARATAVPATRPARSGSGTYRDRPSPSSSLNENGTLISRPSNSGMATWVAASSGRQAAVGGGPRARGEVRHSACRIGDVEGGDGAGVPGLVVAAGLRQRRGRAAGGEHRHHQRVGPARAARAGPGRRPGGWRTRPAGRGPPRGLDRPRRATSTNSVLPASWWAR